MLRKVINPLIPSQLHDPLGLAMRMIRSRDSAALFAIESAILGIVLTPLDLILENVEKRYYEKAAPPRLPLIFVCGAARTGTTLVSQVLINHLSVSYINNLAAIFPRSPIVTNLLFARLFGNKAITYTSYYGKTPHFSGPNELHYLWDRWLGGDRTRTPATLSRGHIEQIIRFFGAYEQVSGRPLVHKANRLNTCANVIADVLDNSYFICMTREPSYLAQSLLKARIDIHAKPDIPYGVKNHGQQRNQSLDYVEDVCEQVLFHEQRIKEQEETIGTARFWIIPYEEFCEKPELLVKKVSEQILEQPVEMEKLRASLKPFDNSNNVRLEPELFRRIKDTLTRLKRDGKREYRTLETLRSGA